MRNLVPDLERWLADGKRVALATVVRQWGSAPRPLGAKLALSSEGELSGSVSGGCVEGAVVEAAQGVLAGGEPRRLAFGVSDEDAWAVGLSCGGEIEVFVEVLRVEAYRALKELLDADRAAVVATVVAGPGTGSQLLVDSGGRGAGALSSRKLTELVHAQARQLLRSLSSERSSYELDGEVYDVFLDVYPPRPQLVVVGAVHVAIPLVAFARTLGFKTVVIDPRTAFATAERFAAADQLLHGWPQEALPQLDLHENTYLASLSHDPKLDLPALRLALASPARYVGALGSKKTHAKRLARLRAEGCSEEQLGRLHAPIGLDLGGRQAEEIALAILAEMVAVRHGRRMPGQSSPAS